ncbi:YwiC-like family protein, partial [Bifidobacterium cuniculi]
MTSLARRRSRRDWFSNEPGSWAIVLMPSLAAWLALGPTWTSTWLVALWALCYCLQFTAARWFKARFRRRWLAPVAVYAAVLVAAGLPFLILHPGTLRWAPIYMVLCAGSMLGAWLRREHSLWANACAVLASSTMPLMIGWFGSHASPATAALGRTLSWPWLPAAAFPGPALAIAVTFALELYGSVLFVKTMIRERGDRRYLAASWTWHLLLCAAGFAMGPWYALLAIVLLARATLMPLAGARRKVPTKVVGMVECVCITLTFVVSLLAM